MNMHLPKQHKTEVKDIAL